MYVGTKWALEGFAESLRDEVKPFGSDVVIVEPGAFLATPAMTHAMQPENAGIAAEYAKMAGATLPAGHRPLGTVVGRMMTGGVSEYNEAYERRSRLIEGLHAPSEPLPRR